VPLGLINLSYYWVADALKFLHLFIQIVLICILVGVKPVVCLSQSFIDCAFVSRVKFIGKLVFILDGVAHGVDVILEGVLRVNLLFYDPVLLCELLCLFHHPLDLLRGQMASIVLD